MINMNHALSVLYTWNLALNFDRVDFPNATFTVRGHHHQQNNLFTKDTKHIVYLQYR